MTAAADVERALAALHSAAVRVGETIVAAPPGCECPVLHLSALTTQAEVRDWVCRLQRFAGDLPGDLDDPVSVSYWLERSLSVLGLRPGVGQFPARHSHTLLPMTAVAALRERPDDERLRHQIAYEHRVQPLEALCAALPDGPGWHPEDDTGDDGPCTWHP